MKELLATVRPAVVSLLVFTGLLGLAYPLVVGGVAAVTFPHQARGSLIHDREGRVVGSERIGQPFEAPGYFWGRPSAVAGDAMTSSGTNLGPSNPALREAVIARIAALRAADPGNLARVPIDLVTASASGLDPEISPAAAYYQLGRVARARGVPEATIRALIDRHVEERTLGLLGERRVNVLRLDRALDLALGAPR
jgi:K+-transporting ATPase ATPase C chain